jgi:hypothetical protein
MVVVSVPGAAAVKLCKEKWDFTTHVDLKDVFGCVSSFLVPRRWSTRASRLMILFQIMRTQIRFGHDLNLCSWVVHQVSYPSELL